MFIFICIFVDAPRCGINKPGTELHIEKQGFEICSRLLLGTAAVNLLGFRRPELSRGIHHSSAHQW